MKGLYVSNVDPQNSIGYKFKISGQVKGFRDLGSDVDLICFDDSSQVLLTYFDRQSEQILKSRVLAAPSSNLLKRRLNLLKAAISHISIAPPDFLYLRYPRSEPLYLFFLARVRKLFPSLIILCEFPTYPYDKEYKGVSGIKDRFVFFVDKIIRRFLKQFINRAVSINYELPIFGIDTISIDNGIDVSSYLLIPESSDLSDVINIIGVANVSLWHGYDRVIKGLGEYYRQDSDSRPKVIFHIVGARLPYLDELRELVSQENVIHSVVFHEPRQGKSLDSLFMNCHLAVGVLGGHRKGLETMSPLKNREYCARGIPFIFSHVDPDFPEDFKYCLRTTSDESPVSIQNLISFISQLSREDGVASKMRDYANSSLEWAVKLKPVQAYIDDQVKKLSCG